jgi:regulation of enolase protein 1 (concanavalin A-like superfamily)
MDVDSLSPGVDFRAAVERALAASEVLLALIGPGWTNAVDEHGQRRLDDPDDLVAFEIATALSIGLRVIPVLVDGASMPRAAELPDRIRPLRSRQAVELDHRTFSTDADMLVQAVKQPGRLVVIGRRLRRRPALLATAVLLVVAVAAASAVVAVRGWGVGATCAGISDDFGTGSLDPRWTRTNDAGGTRTFEIAAGRLVIKPVPGADVRADHQGRVTAPYLNAAVDSDFSIETTLTADPLMSYQAAGLLLLHDQNNYVRLERGFGSFDAIAFEFTQNGVHIKLAGPYAGEPQPVPVDSDDVSLRLVRTGGQVSAFWRDDRAAGEWQELRNTAPLQGEATAGIAVLDTTPAGDRAPFTAAFDRLSIACDG